MLLSPPVSGLILAAWWPDSLFRTIPLGSHYGASLRRSRSDWHELANDNQGS